MPVCTEPDSTPYGLTLARAAGTSTKSSCNSAGERRSGLHAPPPLHVLARDGPIKPQSMIHSTPDTASKFQGADAATKVQKRQRAALRTEVNAKYAQFRSPTKCHVSALSICLQPEVSRKLIFDCRIHHPIWKTPPAHGACLSPRMGRADVEVPTLPGEISLLPLT